MSRAELIGIAAFAIGVIVYYGVLVVIIRG